MSLPLMSAYLERPSNTPGKTAFWHAKAFEYELVVEHGNLGENRKPRVTPVDRCKNKSTIDELMSRTEKKLKSRKGYHPVGDLYKHYQGNSSKTPTQPDSTPEEPQTPKRTDATGMTPQEESAAAYKAFLECGETGTNN